MKKYDLDEIKRFLKEFSNESGIKEIYNSRTEKEKVIDVKYFITNSHKIKEYMQEKANEQANISFDVLHISKF